MPRPSHNGSRAIRLPRLTRRSVLALPAAFALATAIPLRHVTTAAAQAVEQDWPIEGGRFYTQTGDGATMGYAVVDDSAASFWAAFQQFDGVGALGYPISNRFQWVGTPAQAFQRGILRWYPDPAGGGSAGLVNAAEEFTVRRLDQWLKDRTMAPPAGWPAEFGRTPEQIRESRTAAIQRYPALYDAYTAPKDPTAIFGAAVAPPAENETAVVLRTQKAILQLWKIDVPWAAAGQVTLANVGELWREAGFIAADALAMIPSPPRIQVTQGGTVVKRPVALPPNWKPWWVANFADVALQIEPDGAALSVGQPEPGTPFEVLEPQLGEYLHVRDLRSDFDGWVFAGSMGPIDKPEQLPAPSRWRGYVRTDALHVRTGPTTRADSIGEIKQGTPVIVRRWVEGQEVFPDDLAWGELDDNTYVYGALLKRAELPPPDPPADAPADGKWLDANLSLQSLVAYEERNPVISAVYSSGRPGWLTPAGRFSIRYRVASERMDGSTVLSQDANTVRRANYVVENVKWTQYFTTAGDAIHGNYWRNPELFGIPSSHGCLGMPDVDAKKFWDWATVGTPVYVHY